MLNKNVWASLTLAILAGGCGGTNEPTQAQRAALAEPLFETEYAIVERKPEDQFDLSEPNRANPDRKA